MPEVSEMRPRAPSWWRLIVGVSFGDRVVALAGLDL